MCPQMTSEGKPIEAVQDPVECLRNNEPVPANPNILRTMSGAVGVP